MRKGYTLVEALTVLATIAILAGFAIKNERTAVDTALNLKAMHSTLMQKAKDEAYKLIANNETESKTYEIENKYTVNVQQCNNGFILELYDKDLEFDEDTEDCNKKDLREIVSFNACKAKLKSEIKLVCKI